MSAYRPTQIEKETIILFNEAENEAEIYTYNQKLISMLKKRPEIANLKRKDNTGAYTFIIPKSYLKINLKRKLSQAELAQRQINRDKINSRRKSRADLTQTTDG